MKSSPSPPLSNQVNQVVGGQWTSSSMRNAHDFADFEKFLHSLSTADILQLKEFLISEGQRKPPEVTFSPNGTRLVSKFEIYFTT